jgi:hypothetical protein
MQRDFVEQKVVNFKPIQVLADKIGTLVKTLI